MNLTREDVPQEIQRFFEEHPRVALAYSGGCDSVYLLACAHACGAEVHPFLVDTVFQYGFEYHDAVDAAREIGVDFTSLQVDILNNQVVAANPPDRCYHCKRAIFTAILDAARERGISVLIDGTNATDNPARRPGFRALAELEVLSPLRQAGLTKDEIRERSARAGLFTSEKPNYSCLATRVEAGTPLTYELLAGLSQEDWRNR